jgi:hypothetical protein
MALEEVEEDISSDYPGDHSFQGLGRNLKRIV